MELRLREDDNIYYCLRRKRKHPAEDSDNWQWYVVSGSGMGSWAREFGPRCLADGKVERGNLKRVLLLNPGSELVEARIDVS